MKKFIFLILFLVGVLILPITIFAAIHGPNECCTLDHDLIDIDPVCIKDVVVAAKGCDTLPANSACLGGTDDCWTDKTDPPDGDYVDPEDTPCENCWCDSDGDGENNANCLGASMSVTKNWGTCCIVDAIYNVTDWIFYVLLAAVAIVFILGGFFFLSAGGDPYKVRQAQNFLLYGVIGLVLALLARIIPGIIKGIVS